MELANSRPVPPNGDRDVSRRTFLSATALAAVGAVATACSGSAGPQLHDEGKPVPGGPKTTRNPDVLYPKDYEGAVASFKGPITTERARLRIVVPQNATVGDWSTNEFTKWYEKRTNVHVDWAVVPAGDDGATKVNAMIASGDLPDIFMTSFTPSQLALFGQDQGLFIPMDDLIRNYGVEIHRVFDDYPLAKQVCTAPDGHIYALPTINDCTHCQGMANRAFIYQPWLDKLGLAMPTTTDELEEVLTAFKTGDPNGNNNADEIPFTASNGIRLDAYFMTAFLHNPDDPWLVLENDQVDVVFNKPEWREGLKYMNRLMAKGLIAQEGLTQTAEQLQKQGNADTPILGAVRASGYWDFVEIDAANPHARFREYACLPPVKGPEGVQVSHWNYYQFGAWPGPFTITKASKIPEIAFMWGDGLYELTATTASWYGPPGRGKDGLRWAEKGDKGLTGDQAVFRGPVLQPQHATWVSTQPMFWSADWRNSQAVDPAEPTYEQPLYYGTMQAYHPYRVPVSRVMPPLYMNFESAGAISDMSITINEYVRQSTAFFTTGEQDPNDDSDWNDYLDTLTKMGISEYLQIYQQAYDERA